MSRARDLGSLINSTAAGKNVIINGAFDIWQRGTSFNANNGYFYTADRWMILSNNTGGNVTITRESFAPGTAPTAAVEGTYFLRNTAVSPTGAVYNVYQYKIEDVRTFAGQTVTVSFWAKADSNRTIYTQFFQNFGNGGSGEVYNGTSFPNTLTTSWQRFSTTLTLPSISGKTIGAGNNLRFEFALPINVSSVIDIWGVQLEPGSSATSFSRAGGDIDEELSKCQRYYQRFTGPVQLGTASKNNSTSSWLHLQLIKTMRSAPSFNRSAIADIQIGKLDGSNQFAANSVSTNRMGNNTVSLVIGQGTADGTTGDASSIFIDNSTGWIEFSSEL